MTSIFSKRTQQRIQKENRDLAAENGQLKQSLAGVEQRNRALTEGFERLSKDAIILAAQRAELMGINARLEREKDASDDARRISAEGMALERDELLNRAARLNMRIRGLGFDPQNL
jgi:hypothetical protein